MEHTKHLYRFAIAAIALGCLFAFPSQASAAESSQPERDPVSLNALSASEAVAFLATERNAASLEAIAPDSLSSASKSFILKPSVANRQLSTSLLTASNYTPPDNGGPDDSRGSGTR